MPFIAYTDDDDDEEEEEDDDDDDDDDDEIVPKVVEPKAYPATESTQALLVYFDTI